MPSPATRPLSVLVVGGAGYIGSHMVKRLVTAGCRVATLDNLSGGHRDAVLHGEFIEGDLADRALLQQLFSTRNFDADMHFASLIQIGESVQHPAKYYENNVVKSLNLLEAMRVGGVTKRVFSSTAAIFGEPQAAAIDESHPKNPINPCGRTKLVVEQALADHDRAYGLKSVCLRYFKAAGADPQGELGERHAPKTRLIPLVLQAASGRRPNVSVLERDYDTPDGTCIRDYIHVADLCEAHRLALQALAEGAGFQAFNLGNGNGFSVQEVIDTARRVTGRQIDVTDLPRLAGDPARLVADARLAREKLGWRPEHGDLGTIAEHAWRWERNAWGLERG